MDWRIEKIKTLAHPMLQKYCDQPPGELLGVVYAAVCGNGVIYVGRHIHGKSANSTRAARWNQHGRADNYLGRSIRKYGVQWYIIGHEEERDVPELEKQMIGPTGLDTLHSSNPKGANFHPGESELSPIQDEPYVRQRISKSTPEWKAAASARAKKACENQDPDVREAQLQRILTTTRSSEYRQRRSDTHWTQEETEEHVEARSPNRRVTVVKNREEKLANATPIGRRYLEAGFRKMDRVTTFSNQSKRKYSLSSEQETTESELTGPQRQSQTTMMKRAKRLADATPEQRRRMETWYRYNDERYARVKALAAGESVPELTGPQRQRETTMMKRAKKLADAMPEERRGMESKWKRKDEQYARSKARVAGVSE